MLLIRFIISILTLYFSGRIILKFLHFKENNLFETIPLAFGLGAGFVGISMFFLSLSRISFSLWLVILPILILFFIYLRIFKADFLKSKNKKLSFKWNFSFFESMLLFFIIFEIIYAFLRAGILPFESWDAWCTWGFKAKMLFMDRTFNFKEWLRSPNIPHLNYPLLLSLQETYIYVFLGRIYEPLARIFCSLYFVGIIFYLYGHLHREFSREFSLIICLFLSTTPILLNEAVSGYADIPLSFYSVLAVINLYQYIKKEENARLWLACIFMGLGMWMKNEGASFWLAINISLILIILIAPAFFKRKIRVILSNLLIPWLIFLPWAIFSLILNMKNEIPSKPLSELCILISERSSFILKALFIELINFNRWNISWIIFLFSVIFIILSKKKTELFLCFVILFQSIFFLCVYIFVPSTLAEMLEWCKVSLHRPLLQVYPIALFLVVQCLGIPKTDTKT